MTCDASDSSKASPIVVAKSTRLIKRYLLVRATLSGLLLIYRRDD